MWPEADHFYVENVAVHPRRHVTGIDAALLADADRAAVAADLSAREHDEIEFLGASEALELVDMPYPGLLALIRRVPSGRLMALFLALASSVIFGVADFLGGFASRRVPARLVVLYSQFAGLVAIAIVTPFLGRAEVTGADLLWAAAAGILGMGGLLFFYEGLASGRMSVVSPLAGLLTIALPSAFGIATGERPGLLAVVGIVVAVPAVFLISTSSNSESESTLWRGGVVNGLIGGVGFGGFFILLSRTADASGVWPIVAMRSMTVALLALILLSRRMLEVPERSSWGIIALAGVADVVANLLFLIAQRGTLLILASVLVALYPVSTLVLARFVLGDRTTVPQRYGLGLAVLAVVGMTVG